MLDQSPQFDAQAAERLARDQFRIDGRASPLTSERDKNFLITSSGRPAMVGKIANAAEDRAMLFAQQSALTHLAGGMLTTPNVVRAADGSTLVEVTAEDGRAHLAWAITWLPGRPLGTVARRSPALLADFGRQIGWLDGALADFDSPGIHRDFSWDLANGRAIIDRYRALVTDAELARTLDLLIAQFDRNTAPLLDKLPRAAIHNDLNDYNVLVSGENLESRDQSVTGIVDFGDMVHSYRAGDLAIAIAYAILGSNDPLTDACRMVRGYSEHVRLADDELAALFGLVVLRLCTSVCIAADQLRQRPDNEYLGVSQTAIAELLPALAAIPFRLAEAAFREAAGVPSVPASERVSHFLRRTTDIAPVLGFDLRTEPSIVLDLSIASPLVGGDAAENAEPKLTERVFGAMREAGVRVSSDATMSRGCCTSRRRSRQAMSTERFTSGSICSPSRTACIRAAAGHRSRVRRQRGAAGLGPVIVLRRKMTAPLFTLYDISAANRCAV